MSGQRADFARRGAKLEPVPFDTSPEALHAQTLAQRRMGGPRRFLLACELSRTMRTLARERITSQRPGLDERAILDEMIFELYGCRRGT